MKLAAFLLIYILVAIISLTSTNGHEQHHVQTNAVPQHAVHSATSKVAAGSHDKKGKHHSESGHVKHSGSHSVHDAEKAKKGASLKENHKKASQEKAGKKSQHHAEAGHASHHNDAGGKQHAAGFKQGQHHKKNNFKKGFREVYHKDEAKKHDSFYSTGHKSGDFEIFGSKNSKHNANHHSKVHHATNKAVKSSDHHAKSGKKLGGHNKKDDKGHKSVKSSGSKHSNHHKYANKGAKSEGKKLKYNHK